MKNFNNLIPLQNNWISEKVLLDWFLEWLGINYDELLYIISKLERTDKILVVSDFDDTLYSRFTQLKNPLLRENRWYKWNEIIVSHFWWFSKFVDEYYYTEWLTKEIVSKIKNNISLILTAWIKIFQELKIKKVWLDNIPRVIVEKNNMKSLALLKYILFELKKIPKLIEIYDDRVTNLCENGQKLSDLLQTEIIVTEVQLEWNKVAELNNFTWNSALKIWKHYI